MPDYCHMIFLKMAPGYLRKNPHTSTLNRSILLSRSHDLNLIVDTAQEVRKVSIQHTLNKSQTWALEKLHRVSKSRFTAFIQESPEPRTKEQGSDGPSPGKGSVGDFSAAEIERITEKEIKKQALAEQERVRNSSAPVESESPVHEPAGNPDGGHCCESGNQRKDGEKIQSGKNVV